MVDYKPQTAKLKYFVTLELLQQVLKLKSWEENRDIWQHCNSDCFSFQTEH